MSPGRNEREGRVTSPQRWLTLAIALPAAGGALGAVLWMFTAAVGWPAGADAHSLTLSEAAAIASHADVARLLRYGADPNAPSRLRAGLVGNQEHTVTPLEAATASIRTGPISLLVEAGAVVDEHSYPVLWCSARARGNRDMLEFLETRRPSGQSPIDCSSIRTSW